MALPAFDEYSTLEEAYGYVLNDVLQFGEERRTAAKNEDAL